MYVCKYVCMYVCMYACMYISMYVYIYVCVCNPNLVYLQQYEEKVKDMKKHREGVADAKVKRVHKRREDKERQKQNIPEASLDMYVCACMDEWESECVDVYVLCVCMCVCMCAVYKYAHTRTML